jgi:hypothetical protein
MHAHPSSQRRFRISFIDAQRSLKHEVSNNSQLSCILTSHKLQKANDNLLALDHPFLLLPFRPTSDPSAVRTFIRHFFDGDHNTHGEALTQELRMTEPMVYNLCFCLFYGLGWAVRLILLLGHIRCPQVVLE